MYALLLLVFSFSTFANNIQSPHHTGLKDAKQCASCHQEIYKEWSDSIHAKSSYYQDPIHQAVVNAYQKFKKSKGRKADYHCASCHTPVTEDRVKLMQAKTSLKPERHSEGVSCRSCHSINAIKHHKNFDRPEYDKASIVYSSLKEKNQAAHPVKNFPFKDPNTMCLSCHAHKHNGKGTGICVMTGKNGELTKNTKANCISCHMPQKNGHSSHYFPGSRNRKMLAPAFTLKKDIQNDKLTVKLSSLIPHTFPSSQPLRQAIIKIKVFNKSKKLIWENKPTPKDKTLMMVALADKKGNWPVPPWKAHSRKFDTRLQGSEKRTYSFKNKLFKNNKIKVQVLYRLLSPKAAKAFGVHLKHTKWQLVKEI